MSVPRAERLARAALTRVAEPGDPRMTHLVHELGGEEVWEGLRRQSSSESGFNEDLASRIERTDPEAELAAAERRGIRFLVPGDDEWPERLTDLTEAPHLHNRGGVPLGLWVRGPLRLAEVVDFSAAVVGSRSSTTYGCDVAGAMGADLAAAGCAVVSGAAYGIDQAAHRGALAARGPTVAVLACGADRAYPEAHASLLDYIAETGLVVSEAPLRGAPTRIRFLARNRLIAAVARGTVVVEAAVRSGALNTASWSYGMRRPVLGVPGPVTSAASEGVHHLIRAKDALLVTSAAHVLEVLGPAGSFMLSDPRAPENPRDRLSEQDQQVLDAVPVYEAATEASVAHTAGLSRKRTGESLARLHRLGHVEHALGRWRMITETD